MKLNTVIAPEVHIPIVHVSMNNFKTKKSLLDLIDQCNQEVITQLNQYGAILFRGFSCQDLDSFSNAIAMCGLGDRCSTKDYDLPRTLFANDIYTSSNLPGHIPLPLHHEKPRSKNPPNHLYFCCITPPDSGGGTIFANAKAIWQDMPKSIQDKIMEYGVVYKQFFYGNTLKNKLLQRTIYKNTIRCWQEYFGTDEKNHLEKKFTLEGIHWEWVNKGRDLILLNYLPGALKHPITHEMLWFNSSAYLNYYSAFIYGRLDFFKYLRRQYLISKDRLSLICHYGNGCAFSSDEIEEINRVSQLHSRVLNWQKGDFMIVDNFSFMHGKQAHQGNRLLYSCMTAF